jgi:transposase-like protein
MEVLLMEKGKQAKRKYSEEERARLVEGYRNSGLAQKEWCQLQDIAVVTLGKWQRQEKNQQKDSLSKQGWAQVSVAPLVEEEPIHLKAGKFSITICQNTNMKVLSELLAVLVPLC